MRELEKYFRASIPHRDGENIPITNLTSMNQRNCRIIPVSSSNSCSLNPCQRAISLPLSCRNINIWHLFLRCHGYVMIIGAPRRMSSWWNRLLISLSSLFLMMTTNQRGKTWTIRAGNIWYHSDPAPSKQLAPPTQCFTLIPRLWES